MVQALNGLQLPVESPKAMFRTHSLLFTIYINDQPDMVQNIANLFADDTRAYAIINNEEDRLNLQNDLTTS